MRELRSEEMMEVSGADGSRAPEPWGGDSCSFGGLSIPSGGWVGSWGGLNGMQGYFECIDGVFVSY